MRGVVIRSIAVLCALLLISASRRSSSTTTASSGRRTWAPGRRPSPPRCAVQPRQDVEGVSAGARRGAL